MKRLLPILLLACGGLTPQSYCEDTYQVTCHKWAECQPDASYSDCVAQDESMFMCSSVMNENVCAGQGAAQFDPNAAQRCLNDIQALSCATIAQTNFTLPSTCAPSEICP
jgi:hypothetical protein